MFTQVKTAQNMRSISVISQAQLVFLQLRPTIDNFPFFIGEPEMFNFTRQGGIPKADRLEHWNVYTK